ncbi:MAG: hypothetical protein P4L99_23910 [Chthoniobacter sp.]|nr:hypothetical protein [Chthoniobacter sp.]
MTMVPMRDFSEKQLSDRLSALLLNIHFDNQTLTIPSGAAELLKETSDEYVARGLTHASHTIYTRIGDPAPIIYETALGSVHELSVRAEQKMMEAWDEQSPGAKIDQR